MNKNLHTKQYWREQFINAFLLGMFIGCFGGLFISSLLNWLDRGAI